MANTVVKDLMIKNGIDLESGWNSIFDQALELNGELKNGAKTAIEQFGEVSGKQKYNWGRACILEMTGSVLTNKDVNKIAKCVIDVLGGSESDFMEFKAMNTINAGLRSSGVGKYTKEQKEGLVQQAYDSRVEKAEELVRIEAEKAEKAKLKAAAPKRVKKTNVEMLDKLNESASSQIPQVEDTVDDILSEFDK